MGRKGDQDYGGETYRPADHSGQAEAPSTTLGRPPPLPPRGCTTSLPNALSGNPEAPPQYTVTPTTYHSQPVSQSWAAQDPRSSSTQSLVPHSSAEGDGNRTLLLVYIHGFMGNETSFQSFPAHIHNIVTVKLGKSHAVHTKIYPKYKSRRHIEFARDGFSDWLRPHESADTDVILLGHSMGGILSTEVALLKSHRILGTINFDTPFLGMHPGVIASGLGSLFRPALDSPVPKPTEDEGVGRVVTRTATDEGIQSSSSTSYFGPDSSSSATLMRTESSSTATLPISSSSSLGLPVKDPYYDPPFVNDIRLPQRSGWANALHFINKHSDGLSKATQSYVKSHLEFGGAMADYNGLKKRYEKVRALEDVDSQQQTRIRFVNYYTASTGRPKKPKSNPVSRIQTNQLDSQMSITEEGMQDLGLEGPHGQRPPLFPRFSIDKPDGSVVPTQGAEDTDDEFLSAGEGRSDDEGVASDTSHAMDHMDPAPMTDDERTQSPNEADGAPMLETETSETPSEPGLSKPPSLTSLPQPTQKVPNLPPVPAEPEEPSPFDPTLYTDKDTRKLAERDHARQVKAYKQAVKDHKRALSDRCKFLEKREKNAAKEREKQIKAEDKERLKLEKRTMEKGERERAKVERSEEQRLEKEKARLQKEELRMKAENAKLAADKSIPIPDGETELPNPKAKPEKPKRDKKFCMLPPRLNGRIDPCWIRVFMPGVDEVGAHCGLFFVDGDRYQRFVSDVAERIVGWVEGSEKV